MTKRKHPSLKKSGALLAAALLTSSLTSSFAGETAVKSTGPKPLAAKAPASNPLSFYDGKFTFDVQERFRWEIRENNFDFNDAVNALTDDNWFLQRFRIGLLIKPVSWLKIYGQGQDSREINSDRPDFPGQLAAEGDDTFDLRQGYVEIGDPKLFPLSLKVGRQILSYGDERLIGAFDWNNIGRTFDAAKLRFEQPGWWVEAFASAVVVPIRGSFNKSDVFDEDDLAANDTIFYGLYASTAAIPFQSTDFYALGLASDQETNTLPTAASDTHFATIGLRMKSKPGAFAPTPPAPASDGKSVTDGKSAPPSPAKKKPIGFDYSLEAAFQTGEVRGLDLTAFAVHVDAGYTFDAPCLPRVALGYSYGTGDGDPLDGDSETFQNLFPTNHKFYGQMDVFSWQNLHDLEVNFKVQPIKPLTLRADFHAFFLASTDDVWYRANGSTAVRPLNAAARNADSYAGAEIDVLAVWAVHKNFSVEAGYSHFFAGTYLEDTGASSDADFGYVQATISF